ncbi:uracil-Dna glycosylase [Cardiosporidium cionae]|uniref:Uracil-Dna glycosylase n=1 Tax=Cardiosporidium cionae TaxID=476202 RepID=A0ABQ7J4D3_9APIC|nr:uracil-Dna glycosylase [Cardiosporidium cionae]|eukprot:KAF8817928.1 uracil-Dna glycosylase [Cardiosporidium cionae]
MRSFVRGREVHGLCFSVPRGKPCPPSLKNILKEIGCVSSHGDLTSWSEQGVFLLNSLLTVVDSHPMAHKDSGWERFTDGVIDIINSRCENVIFLLWGKPAQKKAARVNRKKHHVLEAGHPSPLSVRFFQGCQHFKKCNEILRANGRDEIQWILPP